MTNKDYFHPATITADGTLYHLNKTTGAWEAYGSGGTLRPGDGELLAVR